MFFLTLVWWRRDEEQQGVGKMDSRSPVWSPSCRMETGFFVSSVITSPLWHIHVNVHFISYVLGVAV